MLTALRILIDSRQLRVRALLTYRLSSKEIVNYQLEIVLMKKVAYAAFFVL